MIGFAFIWFLYEIRLLKVFSKYYLINTAPWEQEKISETDGLAF